MECKQSFLVLRDRLTVLTCIATQKYEHLVLIFVKAGTEIKLKKRILTMNKLNGDDESLLIYDEIIGASVKR